MAREMKIPRHEQYKDSVYTYQVDLTLIEQALGLTVNAVTWSTQDSCVTIGTSALASSVASAPITAVNTGSAKIKLAITTSGDDAPVYFFEVNVLDPEMESSAYGNWR